MEAGPRPHQASRDAAPEPLHPQTRLGAIRLNVADIDGLADFYEQVVGLRPLVRDAGVVRLGAGEGTVVELESRPGAPPRPAGSTGLFHLAIVVPTRRDLAVALNRVAHAGGRLTGASDHLVSEALYLRDPEGNGIEIYRDRPRQEWTYSDGRLEMDTLPLDLEGVLGALDGVEAEPGPVAPGTHLGHVHLQVADLARAEDFYRGVLGFDVTVRGYPGALFASAGGYHHHVGLNTWAGEGAPPPPPDALGLAWFEVVVPGGDELQRVERRLGAVGVAARRRDEGLQASDPSGNGVLVRPAG